MAQRDEKGFIRYSPEELARIPSYEERTRGSMAGFGTGTVGTLAGAAAGSLWGPAGAIVGGVAGAALGTASGTSSPNPRTGR